MSKGSNMLCDVIRQYGLDSSNGDVYVFIGSSRHILKYGRASGGYAIYYKSLEARRISPCVFHHDGCGFRSMGWNELVLFMMGMSHKMPRRKRCREVAGTAMKKHQRT